MPQCRVPLDWTNPGINLCINEAGHDKEPNPTKHETYGLGWGFIEYWSPNKFLHKKFEMSEEVKFTDM